MNVLSRFAAIKNDEVWRTYGWGIDIADGTDVLRYENGGTVIYVGETNDGMYVCEVESEGGLVGQWDGIGYYDALTNALVDAVITFARRDMQDEPREAGLKYCTEDVVLAAATYGAQVVFHGYDKVRDGALFPHTCDGVLNSAEEIDTYIDMVEQATKFIELYGDRYGIEQ